MKKLSNVKKLILILIGSLAITSLQKSKLQYLSTTTERAQFSATRDALHHSPLFAKNTPLMGFSNIAANYTFIQFLLYFGDDEVRRLQGYRDSPAFFETIIRRDPYFKDFYFFLSQSISVYAGMPNKAIEIMDKGIENLSPNQPSDGYHIWRYKGIDELLFAIDGKAAQHSFEMAANWAAYSREPDSEVVGKMSQQTAQFLAANPDSKPAQISAWSSILISALDDEVRANAVEKIRELGGNVVFSENGGVIVKYAQENQFFEDSDG